MIRRLLLLAGLLLLIVAIAAGFVLSNPNRFKAELQALLVEQTGVPLKIRGDLDWRLLPPLVLTAQDVHAEQTDQQWTIGSLALDLDVMTVIRTRDVNSWRVQALELSDVTLLQDGDKIEVHTARLADFSLGQPAAAAAEISYTADYERADATTLPISVDGFVTYHADPQRIELTDTDFATDGAAGTCTATFVPIENPGPLPEESDDDLVNVATFRSFDWNGECRLTQLVVNERDFEHGVVTFVNKGGVAGTILEVPEFFGGEAKLRLVTDASQNPVRWQLSPTLTGVDSQQLIAWLDQQLQWIAPLAYGGSLEFTGNTQAELLASMRGSTTFDGGQGRISVSEIKAPLLRAATLLNEPERVAAWPELWDYQKLAGTWNVNGTQHVLDLALDNLKIAANGTYDLATDHLDMLAELQFATLAEGQMFDVNPLLMDLPIPVHCVGPVDAPKCSLPADAAKQLLSKVLTSDENSAMRAKLDETIEEKVPEEYRDAARGLLDLLGGALQQAPEQGVERE